MRTTPAPTTTTADGLSDRLSWPLLIVPTLLVAIYAMLSYISLADQATFYDSMDIPTPEHEFLLWSWGGKNTAMVTVLVIGVVTRLRPIVLTSLAMLVVGQLGDLNAGAQSGTNVFVTWIALGLVVLQVLLLILERRGQLLGRGVAD
ncbi:MAG: hypothetical protein AAF531_27905 [Actinomycetota bacterium]